MEVRYKRGKTMNEIVQRIIGGGLASSNEELQNQFEFFAGEDGWTDEQIAEALASPWFPWLKNPAAVALGKLGGSRTSERKAAAVRENGKAPVKPGSRPRGRPRKQR